MRGRRIALAGVVALLVGVLGLVGAGTALAWGPGGRMMSGYGASGTDGPGWGGMMGGYGPGGMMGGWYGQGPQGQGNAPTTGPMTVTPEQAKAAAQKWLDQYQPGSSTEEPDQFYGYYTVHTLKDAKVSGMLSVNGYTGQVWYHSWHGSFVQLKDFRE